MENRFAVTERIAGAVWREITTVAAMGREEKGRRRALRIKVSKALITSARGWPYKNMMRYDSRAERRCPA